jgi:uncharacterized membrane protein YgcG
MAEPYVPFCTDAPLAPVHAPSAELVLRERLCCGPAGGLEREQTLINFGLAREARLEADERARDAQHGTGRWRSAPLRQQHDAFQELARGIEVDVDDAGIAARQAARQLAVRGVALDEAHGTHALAAGLLPNAQTATGASALVCTAVANAAASVRCALTSPSGSAPTAALEVHVAEVAAAAERPIAGPLAALRLKIWDMRLHMFFLRLLDGVRGAAAAEQWFRDAKAERESEERSLVFGTLFINAAAKRARDDEALTRALAPAPKVTPTKRRPATKRKPDGRGDHRENVDRSSGRRGGGRGGGGGRGSGGGGGSESAPS